MKGTKKDKSLGRSLFMENLMSVKQAAAALGLKVPTLYKMSCARSGPKFVKLGSRILYRQTDLEGFVNARVVEPFSGRRGKS